MAHKSVKFHFQETENGSSEKSSVVFRVQRRKTLLMKVRIGLLDTQNETTEE